MIEKHTIQRLEEAIVQLESTNREKNMPYIIYDLKVVLSELTGARRPEEPRYDGK